MNKPFLSVCIPTYNRAKFIDEAIESVVTQITDDIKDKVELCISDNASTDNTEEIVDKWSKQSPIPIVYHKNEENLGADKNYLKVVEIANGDYCWFLGSDDKIVEGAISLLHKYLTLNDISILIGCRYICSINMNILDKSYCPSKAKDILYNNYYDSLLDTSNYFGYLSVLIFKRELWNQIKIYDNFIGSQFIHVFMLYELIKHYPLLLHINHPIVYYRKDNDSFLVELGEFNRAKINIYDYTKIVEHVFTGDKKTTSMLINKTIPLATNVFKYKQNSHLFFLKILPLATKTYYKYKNFWLRFLPSALLPLWILRLIKNIK